jgi:hypothetical protein
MPSSSLVSYYYRRLSPNNLTLLPRCRGSSTTRKFVSRMRQKKSRIRREYLSCAVNVIRHVTESGQRSRYSDYLRAGKPRGRSSRPGRSKNFNFSMLSSPALAPTHPPTQWVLGALSPGVKRRGLEADHSSPSRSEAKKTWVYAPTPCLHGAALN